MARRPRRTETLDVVTSVRFGPTIVAELERVAELEGVTRSGIIDLAVRSFLVEYQQRQGRQFEHDLVEWDDVTQVIRRDTTNVKPGVRYNVRYTAEEFHQVAQRAEVEGTTCGELIRRLSLVPRTTVEWFPSTVTATSGGGITLRPS